MKNYELIELVRRVNLRKVWFENFTAVDMAERVERLKFISGRIYPGVYVSSFSKNDFADEPSAVVQTERGGIIYYLAIGEHSRFQAQIKKEKNNGYFDYSTWHKQSGNLFYL